MIIHNPPSGQNLTYGMSVIPAEGGMMEVLDQVVVAMITVLTNVCGGVAWKNHAFISYTL